MPKFQRVKGMRDFLPSEASKLRHVEAATREIASLFGFEEIVTPIVERYDLLTAKSGEEIKSRMYVFNDLGGRRVALRPEFTASVARLMATSLRNEPKPLRLFSTGTLYRYDEPQFGRYREFWQSNFEIFGSDRPEADTDILSLTSDLMQKLGVKRFWLKIGHVGILRGLLTEEDVEEQQQNEVLQLMDSKRWENALQKAESLGVSADGISALKRIFRIEGKDGRKILQDTKTMLKDYSIAVSAAENLEQILDLYIQGKIGAEMIIEPRFARGLEYYTGMIFEVLVPEMDISLGGGGRYDKLVEMFGGEPTPAVGVAHGLDRISLALEEQGGLFEVSKQLVFIIPICDEVLHKALEVAKQLRKEGYNVNMEIMGRSVSRALQDAEKREANFAVIIGPREVAEGKVMLRNLTTRQQNLVDLQELPAMLLKK
jgi:histidyl-tRNA synthetase